jgi:hypothetical protein
MSASRHPSHRGERRALRAIDQRKRDQAAARKAARALVSWRAAR